MKKIFNSLFFTILVLFLSTSCDDMLDLEPETDPSDAVMWNSAGAFEKETNNFYTFLPKMQNETSNGVVTKYGFMDREEMADLGLAINAISNSTYGTTETDRIYEEYFKQIRSINYLFKNAETYTKPNEIKQYVAEAHFFRAYISSLMFVDYGPLTIVKTVQDTDSPELYEARASRDDFADFIISDLETAINSGTLPKQADILAGSTNGRITLGAAQALLARICLFEGTWQKYHYNNATRANELLTKAAQYADLVMNDNSYELFRSDKIGVESYRYMFILESVTKCNYWDVKKDANKEYVLRNRFHETVRQSKQNNTHRGRTKGLNRKMIELFLDKNGNVTKPDYTTSLRSYLEDRDPRLATASIALGDLAWSYEPGSTFTRDRADSLRMNYVTWNGPAFFSNKFGGLRPATADADGYDVPIIRLAEVYLTYAEAKCELGNGTISQTDLDRSVNKLRDRVDMPHLTAANIPAGSSMLNEIRRERTVELYQEGFRYDDVRRWKTAEVEMSQALEGVWMGAGSAFDKTWTFSAPGLNKQYIYTPNDNKGYPLSTDGYTIVEGASGRTFKQKNYLRPLPAKQIELNPNLTQNPGWDD